MSFSARAGSKIGQRQVAGLSALGRRTAGSANATTVRVQRLRLRTRAQPESSLETVAEEAVAAPAATSPVTSPRQSVTPKPRRSLQHPAHALVLFS